MRSDVLSMLSAHKFFTRGITYYPPKPFALHLAALILMLFVVIPFVYATLNFLSAPKFDSLDTLCDGHSKFKFDEDSLGSVLQAPVQGTTHKYVTIQFLETIKFCLEFCLFV